MKTKILLLIFLIFCIAAIPAQAGFVIGSGAAAPAANPCADCGTCGGCATADILCEDWDTDNGCTWTDVTTGGTVDQAATPSGAWTCTDEGSKVWDMTRSASADGICGSYTDMGGVKTIGYIHFTFKALSYGGMDTYNATGLICFNADNSPAYAPIVILFRKTSGGYNIRATVRNTSTNVDSSEITNLDEEHEIGIKFEVVGGSNNDSVTLYLDGAQQGTPIADVDFSENVQFVHLGTGDNYASTDRSVHYQIGNIQVDGNAMPSACPK
jgi:hypothetical protein